MSKDPMGKVHVWRPLELRGAKFRKAMIGATRRDSDSLAKAASQVTGFHSKVTWFQRNRRIHQSAVNWIFPFIDAWRIKGMPTKLMD